MNVKLGYTTHFIAGLWWDERLILSRYDVTFKLLTVTADPAKSNIALERLKYMVEEAFQDTVFINHSLVDQIQLLQDAGVKVTVMPEEPVDQIVGMMLYSKINAVMENNVLVRSVLISSSAGDNIIYEHDLTESVAPFDEPGWWNNSGPDYTVDSTFTQSSDKVVIIEPKSNWNELGLDWDDDDNDDDGATVLTFKKDE